MLSVFYKGDRNATEKKHSNDSDGKKNGLLIDRQLIGAPSFVAPVHFGGGIAVADLVGKLTVFPKL